MKQYRIECLIVGAVTLALAFAGAGAQQPSTRDILAWIAAHFETQDYVDGGTHFVSQVRMSFSGCQVTVIQTSSVEPVGGGPPTVSTATLGPVELSNLRPDTTKVSKSGRYFVLSIRSLSDFPESVLGKVFNEQSMIITFSTQDMADRQAKAWHDAIIACGGNAVPNNLY